MPLIVVSPLTFIPVDVYNPIGLALNTVVPTVDATPVAVAGSKEIATGTTTRFETSCVGRGASGEIYHYEIVGSVG